jgi:glycosyltransferase involved in cell wall biosynthesis
VHILLTIPSLNAGGAERVLSELANYWAKKGHQISLVILAAPTEKVFYPLASSIKLFSFNYLAQESLPALSRLNNIFRRITCLRKLIQQLKPNVVISFIDVMNITTLLANIGLHIPIIISERIDPTYRPLPWLYKWLRLKSYPRAEVLVAQTSSSASYFPPTFKHFIRIIPNPVRIAPTVKQASSEISRIVSVGRLEPQKDHQTLIQAFAKIHIQHSSLRLTIYGEGPERANLESLIASFNLSHKVHLPGTTPHIYEALAKADLFVFPSRYEGFPNALCEAMSVGLPVIASNCSGNADIVWDGIDGRLFPVGDEKALVEIIEELINDPEQRQRLSANALTIPERFSEERIYGLWDKLLREALAPSS